jgi:fibrillarin-like rRNA methylase
VRTAGTTVAHVIAAIAAAIVVVAVDFVHRAIQAVLRMLLAGGWVDKP